MTDLDTLDDAYDPKLDTDAGFRRAVYAVLIVASLVYFGIRVCKVRARDGQTPFLSANDRSRWCGVEALLSEGTFAIDEVIKRKGWNSIDKVSHYGKDGKQHYYSSKPPLLYILLAGETWVVERMVGYRLSYKPFIVGRTVIGITNGILLLMFFLTIMRAAERWGRSTWGRIFVVAAATWATLLSPMAASINNHLPGAVATAIAFYQLLRIWYDDAEGNWRYALCGFAAACTFVCELPAAAFLVGVTGALLLKSPKRTILIAMPIIALVGAAFIGTNYVAHDTLKFPYMHRAEGEDWTGNHWYNYPGSYWLNPKSLDKGEPSKAVYAFHAILGHHGILSLTPIWAFSIYGVYLLIAKRKQYATALAVIGLTLLCLVFFILMRPEIDRNYGGTSCGLRWVFWLIPLWLIALIPAADRILRMPQMKWVALVALIASTFSACFHGLNPWSHPWIYQMFW